MPKHEYVFETGTANDLPSVYALIDARIRWMDQVGIEQWNKTDYWHCYPREYYEEAAEAGFLYVLKQEDTAQVVGAVVIHDSDRLWADDKPAYYIHNLVTASGSHGAGAVILDFCERRALENGRPCLRLDLRHQMRN
jgi:GNAT superfamily N-acetyltransferase